MLIGFFPLSSQESELKLLQEEACFHAELKLQQQELEKAELLDEGQDTDRSCTRKQLLQFHNNLREAEEREHQIQYKLEWWEAFLLRNT